MSAAAPVPGLTVVLPTKEEAANLPWLFSRLRAELADEVESLEILVVDTPTGDGTEELCARHDDVRYVPVPNQGFADALRRGFQEAKHPWLVTMDADGSHDPHYIRALLAQAPQADLVIASRYVPRGSQETTLFRYALSRILNYWLGFVWSLPLLDLSGGFKLYRKSIFANVFPVSQGFEIQSEIAIKVYGHGYRIREIPFCYHPRIEGRSKAAIWRYGVAFLKASLRLRGYRNSVNYADYHERAYRSRLPPQRFWQLLRYQELRRLLPPDGDCLDLGCGSGRLILAFHQVTGLDLNPLPLRYLAAEPRKLLQSDAQHLPFADASFDQVYCSELLEYLASPDRVLAEAARVLRPGGKLLICTPDGKSALWPTIYAGWRTVVAGAHDHPHVSRYDLPTLREKLRQHGLRPRQESRVLMGCLLYLVAAKPEEPAAAANATTAPGDATAEPPARTSPESP